MLEQTATLSSVDSLHYLLRDESFIAPHSAETYKSKNREEPAESL